MTSKTQLTIELDILRTHLLEELIKEGSYKDYNHFMTEAIELMAELMIEYKPNMLNTLSEQSQLLIQISQIRTQRITSEVIKELQIKGLIIDSPEKTLKNTL